MVQATDLIAKGYFPRELPPPFRTAQLSEAAADLKISTARDALRSECVRHNLARVGGFRRPLKVPNPKSYIHLARVVEKLWPQLDAYLKQGTLSISRPVPTRTAERALRPLFRLSEAPKFRARHWPGARFVLQSDVSQFYGSIYTHSLPWALHGKAHAKANIGKTTEGDPLDRAIREGSAGQTIGIPIGPDTSLLAAEIVLTAVDQELDEAIGPVKGFRYLDDYDLAFRTRSAAEEAQGHLEASLAEYELVINCRWP